MGGGWLKASAKQVSIRISSASLGDWFLGSGIPGVVKTTTGRRWFFESIAVFRFSGFAAFQI